MQIVIDVADELIDELLTAAKAETQSGLAETKLDAWLADWLTQVGKRAAIHAAENKAAVKAATEFDQAKARKIGAGKAA